MLNFDAWVRDYGIRDAREAIKWLQPREYLSDHEFRHALEVLQEKINEAWVIPGSLVQNLSELPKIWKPFGILLND